MSRQTPHARRLADRRRKRDRAWRETMAWLAAHPGPSSGEVFAEYGRLVRERVEIRAELYRASWEQVFRRMDIRGWAEPHTPVRLARCTNEIEDDDGTYTKCPGTLPFRPEDGDAPCSTCGARCGSLVADYIAPDGPWPQAIARWHTDVARLWAEDHRARYRQRWVTSLPVLPQ